MTQALEAQMLEDLSPAPPRSSPFPLLGRLAGGAWFLLLAILYGRGLIGLVHAVPPDGGGFADWAPVVSRACTLVFLLIQAGLMVMRPPALAHLPGPVPVAIALLGTYGVWAVAFLPDAALPAPLVALSAGITLLGSLSIVYAVLHLGRSFSIAPQARALVTRGPYRLVRHPLYAAEELAVIGVAMHVVWWAAVPFVMAHMALQIRRMIYEETVLRGTFPEYAAYARRTARLIPGVW